MWGISIVRDTPFNLAVEFSQRPLSDEADSESHPPSRARDLRQGLKNRYSAIKYASTHLHFALLNSVSRFSKTSLFSRLNNLSGAILDALFSTICGYIDENIGDVLILKLPDLDREAIRQSYNSYLNLQIGRKAPGGLPPVHLGPS